jgi:hypothetical protein
MKRNNLFCLNVRRVLRLAVAGLVAAAMGTAQGDTPANVAGSGNVLLGSTSNLSTTGTSADSRGGTLPISSINDGNLYDEDDTFDTQGTDTYAYVGITFNSPLQLSVTSVNFYDSIYGNGGWFGVTGEDATGHTSNYNGDAVLSSSVLVDPTLQVTYNGTTWVDVSSLGETVSDNYVTAYTGQQADAESAPPPEATFTLSTPVTGIEGIRLIGTDGGFEDEQTNGSDRGFLGAREFEVEAVPEPSVFALMGLGVAVLFWRVRRRGFSI